MPGQVPEFVMSMMHACIVQQIALATFVDQPVPGATTLAPNSANSNGNGDDTLSSPAGLSKTTAGNAASAAAPITSPSSVPFRPMPPLCASADRAAEFYHRLETLGFTVGLRIAERLLAAQQATTHMAERPQDDAVHLVRTLLWPALFGKELLKEDAGPAAGQPAAGATNSSQGGAAAAASSSHKLLDPDFSWTRSVAQPPDSASLADPFLRAPQTDVLEDATSFLANVAAAAASPSSATVKRIGGDVAAAASGVQKKNAAAPALEAGPNDYVVVLTGLVLGFLSSLGFGSHAERRVFGGDRTSISAVTPAMLQHHTHHGSSGTASESGIAGGAGTMSGSSSFAGAAANGVIARPPGTSATVRHRLVPREGEVRPCGMQLKLVIYFT